MSTPSAAPRPFDLDFVRSQFPAFDDANLKGWAFFENAGGSYAARQTIDRLTNYYTRTKVQPYAQYPASAAAGHEMDLAYERLAGWLNVGVDEVHIGPSTSQNTYVLAKAFRQGWDDGDEIVVTNQDHEANSGSWRRLADTGIVVREWQVDPTTGRLDPSDLAKLLNTRTRLVAFPHCSNIVADLNPIAEIAALVRAADAVTVVDGVSHAPHGLPDVAALGADIYLFSTYKTFGPHQGVMTVRRSVCDSLANQSHWFNDDYVNKRLIPAGPDHAQVAACNGIIDYLEALHDHHFAASTDVAQRSRNVYQLIREREAELLAPLLTSLSARDDVRIMGPSDPVERVPTVAITTATDPRTIVADMMQDKIMCDAGDFYAVRLINAMGSPSDPGVLRMSFVHYTSPEEISRLISSLDRCLG
ncbi:MAG: cysteine desulfurase family protein (TIGR01976 family) [Candidatus Poriferisodalaceae bacterium]|jgi:cysteine desulfurase family protein (TIGR01976 family)